MHQVGHVVGLVLQPLVVGMGARGQALLAHAPAGDACLVHAQAAHVQARHGHLAAQGQLLEEHWVARLVVVAGQPLSDPGLAWLGRLEPRWLARGLLPCVGTHRHGPLVTLVRREQHVKRASVSIEVCPAGVCKRLAPAGHHHARRRGARAPRVLHHPREGGPTTQVEAHRVGHVIDLHARDSHGGVSFPTANVPSIMVRLPLRQLIKRHMVLPSGRYTTRWGSRSCQSGRDPTVRTCYNMEHSTALPPFACAREGTPCTTTA